MKRRYLKRQGGDRDFVELLLQIQIHGMELVGVACKHSLERKAIQLAPIINLINRLAEPSIESSLNTDNYPTIEVLPQANCQRYERLLQSPEVSA